MSVGAVDFIEAIGIDFDGDGDLSGHNDSNLDIESSINNNSKPIKTEKPWLLLDKSGKIFDQFEITNPSKSNNFDDDYHSKRVSDYNVSSGLILPKSIYVSLSLAILGHSFWNASSYLSYFLPEKYGLGETYSSLISILWTLILIISILFIANRLLKGIKTTEFN